jgi:hypothetical protein
MDSMLLREPELFPSEEVLRTALAAGYPAWNALSEMITGISYGLQPEWRYYNDGKAWLCKVCCKKKTVFWLSVWEGYFKTTFYFTAKSATGIRELNIAEDIKEDFFRSQPIGKLLPLTMNISSGEQLNDLLEIINYKKNLK